ncbi:alginate lyase family protein [Roseibium sp.]|uniref:alginate lyase family protein n=1 Tax=Roseibium sp. TaxID=1936156 RepID=UPI003A9722AA
MVSVRRPAGPEVLRCSTLFGVEANRIATRSKYSSAASTAQVGFTSPDGLQDHKAVWSQVRRFVRNLDQMVWSGMPKDEKCALRLIVDFARQGGLEQMESKDAHLTRGRVSGELFLLLLALEQRERITPSERNVLKTWMKDIAADTQDFFDHGAGSMSKRNNHRYWAALSVGAAAQFIGDKDLERWCLASAMVGLDQVRDDGFLPLELRRGHQARNYHVYALRPLLAVAGLSDRHRDTLIHFRQDALKRLSAATIKAMKNPSEISAVSGAYQMPLPAESTYTRQLKFLGGTLLSVLAEESH